MPEELEPVSGEAVFVMLACENQEEVHYAMPVRNMVYDGLAYTDQIQRLWKKRVEEKKTKSNKKMTSAEFLSKFTKKDRLIPVITLVFYYGIEPWDGAKERIMKKLKISREKAEEGVEKYWDNE